MITRYRVVREIVDKEDRLADGYLAALILSERKERRMQEIQVEIPRPWIEALRVSGTVYRRRIS